MKSYIWTSEGKTAVLHDGHDKPQRYNRESLETAIKNVTDQRDMYATEQAWRAQLDKFNEGLSAVG